MSLRDLPVSDLMVTDLLTMSKDLNVTDAMRLLVQWDVGGAPVVDDDDHVIGMLSVADLIVEEARLHFPTMVNFLGVNVALPWHDKELDASVAKALGEFVGDVMSTEVHSIAPDAIIEDAATLMHDEQVSRLAVIDRHDRLVGLIARGDILRAMVLGLDEDDEGDGDEDGDEVEDPELEEDLEDFTDMLEARADADADLAAREALAAEEAAAAGLDEPAEGQE
jgi:CBS domain-containing protein